MPRRLPPKDNFETWHAPYVKAGYDLGLFTDSPEDMRFIPTEGFRMGERGYREMDQPLTRYDAVAILAHTSIAGNGGEVVLADSEPDLSEFLQSEMRLAAGPSAMPPGGRLPLQDVL